MSNINVFKYDEIDINNIVFKEPIKHGQSYASYLSYNGEPLYIQSPILKNLSSTEDIQKSLYVNLEIPLNQLSLYIWFQNLEKLAINKAHINSNKWFNQNIPKEVINNYYNKFIKESKYKKQYNIKCRLFNESNILLCKIYNERGIDIDINSLQKNINMALIFHIDKLVFKKKTFYLDISITQIKAYKELFEKYKYLTDKCVIEDDDTDDFDKSMIFDYGDIDDSSKEVIEDLKDSNENGVENGVENDTSNNGVEQSITRNLVYDIVESDNVGKEEEEVKELEENDVEVKELEENDEEVKEVKEVDKSDVSNNPGLQHLIKLHNEGVITEKDFNIIGSNL